MSDKIFSRWPGIGLAAALAVAVLGGSWFYRTQKVQNLRAAEETLRTTARLKSDQIERWRSERLGDGAVLMKSLPLGEGLAAPEANRESLRDFLEIYREGYSYSNILLTDPEGKVLISLAGEPGELDPAARSALGEAVRERRPVLTELHRGSGNGEIHIAVAVPLFASGGGVAGAVFLQSAARDFLFPLIQSSAVPSETAETLLVRRDGGEVLFLNDLRHREGTALTLRLPLDRPDLPAARAIAGLEGAVRGEDYRGEPVLAVLQPVPGSDWFVISKVDTAEILAAFRPRALLFPILAVALLLIAAALAGLIRQRNQKTYYRTLAQTREERAQTAAELRRLNRELEARVAKRTADLEASNRELEAFAYSVSHDLRAPLRAIEGFSRILEEDYGEKFDGEGKRLLRVVRDNTRKMDQLITDLLELSRAGRTEMELTRVEMGELAEESYREIASPEIREKFDFALGPLPPARGDRVLLGQVWRNLIGNAVKYTLPSPVRRIEISGRREEEENVYSVRDSGVGFDPRYSGKLFGVFQRLHTSAEFPGTGIGLALVRRIVRRHGGRVEAESEPGQGALFRFYLPAGKESTGIKTTSEPKGEKL